MTVLIFYGHHSGGWKLGLQATYDLSFFFKKKADNKFSSPLQNNNNNQP